MRPIVHTFAATPLDRSRQGELKPSDAFEAAITSASAKFCLFHGTSVLVSPSSMGRPALAWHTFQDLQSSLNITIEDLKPQAPSPLSSSPSTLLNCVALGSLKQEDGGWIFALDVTNRPREEMESQLATAPSPPAFESVRGLLANMSPEDIAICGQGVALTAWHRLNLFCGACGSPMLSVEAGGRRACTSCRNRAYPRVDPVIIALIYDPATDSCLLGRQKVYRPGMYSCLAGYIEQVESLEEATRREVKEESGIDVGKIIYHSSQPWPVGRGASCQLMVGFIGEATSTTIEMDSDELEDVRWFTREEVSKAKELIPLPLKTDSGDDNDALSIPGPYAIAHHLIKYWLKEIPPRGRL